MKAADDKMPLVRTLVVLVLLLAVARWLYPKREVFITVISLFFAAFAIAYMLNPLVVFLARNRAPRSTAVLVIFLVIFGGLTLLAIGLLPSIIAELQGLMAEVPAYTLRLQNFLEGVHRDYHRFNLPEGLRVVIDESVEGLEEALLGLFENLLVRVLGFFERFIILLLLPVLVYYFLRDFESFRQGIKEGIPAPYRYRVTLLARDMDRTLGAYLRGILLISALVAFFSYLGLLLLRVDFALLLAIIIGVTNLIPFFGPIIGAVPAVIVALLASPLLALKVVALIFVIQQVESQVLSPPILGRRLGLHPLLILLALILGGRLFGLPGLLIAVPLAACLKISLSHLQRWRETD
jgi:predicted PurR-regulated permease PerM